MTATTRRFAILAGWLLAAGAASAPGAAWAQRAAQQDLPRFLVNTFRAPDPKAGGAAADQLRSRLTSEWQRKVLVIPKSVMDANLKASGFDPAAAPDPVTARQLAQALRADEYLEGTLTKTPNGYRADARMVLTRDREMQQPLPPAEGSPRDIASQLANSLEAARKQLPAERACENALRERNAQVAVQQARAAIAAYPQSTLGRVCLANALLLAKAPTDSVIAVAQEAVQIDPRNKPALSILGQAYKDKGNTDMAIETWTKLLAVDPRNVQLQQQLAQEFARAGQAARAKPIIQQALAENPGDPDLTRLNFLILLANKDWKEAIAAGEALAKVDTAALDRDYFDRLARAYAADSQPQAAAQVSARGVAKFPQDAPLWSLNSQLLRQAGQTQQAVDAARRALSLDPKVELGYLRLSQAQLELGQSDSALASLRLAAQNEQQKPLVGQILLVQGNQAYRAAAASKKRSDFENAVRILSLADSIAPSPAGKFLLGVSAFSVGDAAVRENQQAKSCDLVALAEQSFLTAQTNLPAGGQVQPETAQQLLGALSKYQPVVQSQRKRFCR